VIDAPIDHIAIVVADLEAMLALYTQTLGFTEVYREIVADQGVEVVGLRKTYGATLAPDGMSFTVPAGRVTGLGPALSC